MHLNELGFDQISVEPVVTDPELPYALTESDLPAIAEEYEKLSKILIERKKNGTSFNFFHFMIDLDQGPCAIKRLRGCSCGNEYVAVTPEGDIYPCHQFVGMDEWKMGSVLDDSIDYKMKKMFSKANIYSKKSAPIAGRSSIAAADATPITCSITTLSLSRTSSRVLSNRRDSSVR